MHSSFDFDVGTSFSRFPAGRTDGPHSGQALGGMVVDLLKEYAHITLHLDGALGYSSAFFKGLADVLLDAYDPNTLLTQIHLQSRDSTLVLEWKNMLEQAQSKSKHIKTLGVVSSQS